MAYETIIVETRGKVGLITLEPSEGAQRAELDRCLPKCWRR